MSNSAKFWILKGIAVLLLLVVGLFIYALPLLLFFSPIILLVIYLNFWKTADILIDQDKLLNRRN